MKKLLVLFGAAVIALSVWAADSIPNNTPVTPVTQAFTVGTAGTPIQLNTNGLWFRSATILCQKGSRTNNVGNVYIGTSTNSQPYVLLPGQTWILQAANGCKLNFVDYWLDAANNNDGVIITYH